MPTHLTCCVKDCLYSVLPKISVDGKYLYPECQVTLFKFPSDPERYTKWVESLQPLIKDIKYKRICSCHFAESDFKNPGDFKRFVLEDNAVPSLSHVYHHVEPTKVKEALDKKRAPNVISYLGLSDDFDDCDSDAELDDIIESELGFTLNRDEEDYEMLSDHDADRDPDLLMEEYDEHSSDEEVQMELIKLMAKKDEGVTASPPPPPSPHYSDGYASPFEASPEPEQEDDTFRLFHSLERLYRSLKPETQAVAKEKLLAVMKSAKEIDGKTGAP